MKYEVLRFWDATLFGPGAGYVGMVDRLEDITEGYLLTPQPGEYKDELEKELLTGKVSCILKNGEYSDPEPGSGARVGLEAIVDVAELSRRYHKSEDEIMDSYLHLGSDGKDKVLAQASGGMLLLDDIFNTHDRGRLGVLWKAGGDFYIFDYKSGEILDQRSPGLGARYGNCGKRDFIATITRIMDQKHPISYRDLLTAFDSIRDYEYYHWEDD
jgi:hypothetical protein